MSCRVLHVHPSMLDEAVAALTRAHATDTPLMIRGVYIAAAWSIEDVKPNEGLPERQLTVLDGDRVACVGFIPDPDEECA